MSDDPRQIAFQAGCNGDDPRTCPFEKLTAEWREWQTWHGFGTEWRRLMDGLADIDPPLEDEE